MENTHTTPVSVAIEARIMREPQTSGRRLARDIGVNKNTLSAWRRGRQPRPYQLPKLAAALGVTVEDLRSEPTGAPNRERTPPDLLGLLDQLVHLSEDAVTALAQIGDVTPEMTAVLERTRQLREQLPGE